MDAETTAGWLRDRELIKDLPLQYARGLDTREFSASRAVFSDDCTLKGALGENTIDGYFPGLVEGVQRYEATMHFMGNQYVDLEPGADHGHVETYAVAYHLEPDGSPLADLLMGVRYQDDVERRDGAWKIVRRVAVAQWRRGPFPRPG
jgi:hypothetical protein